MSSLPTRVHPHKPRIFQKHLPLRTGRGPSYDLENLPDTVQGWPVWMVAMYVGLAEGRTWNELAAAATLAAERAGETPWCADTLPLTARHMWRVTHDRRFASVFKPLVDEHWRPRAEPALVLLEKFIAEGMSDSASEDAKHRALAAAKLVLKAAEPPPPPPLEHQPSVQVNVVGETQISLGDLLARPRLPFQPQALLATASSAAREADAVPPVADTQPARAVTSSRRPAAVRRAVEERRQARAGEDGD